METNTILITGFLALVFLLWQLLRQLIEINLHSEQARKQLFEIEKQIKDKTDLRGSKLLDLTDLGGQLEVVNKKLESIESLVDAIKDEKN
jgi:hypothetical protein